MTEYASAGAVVAEIDRLAGEVTARLRAISGGLPSARRLAESVTADLERHRHERNRLRIPVSPAGPPAAADRTLEGLRAAQEALMLAHAEGLPALDDPHAVDVVAHHMVDLSRHLTVTDLWMRTEEERG